MFVTGPDVVAATTGEKVTLDELGGAAIHNFQSGVAHHMADTEEEAIDYVRSLLDYLPSSCEVAPPKYEYIPNPEDEAAARAVADLVPTSARQPYDVRDVVRSLVDHGEYVEIQDLFAPNVTIGFACVDGQSVGIVANQPISDAGTLDVDASEKAARFVRFCDAFGLPIVTFVDVPGYRPGTEQEQAGIIRRGAKVIVAYANATVPMVTVILRKAYGGAYIVMGSKSIGAGTWHSRGRTRRSRSWVPRARRRSCTAANWLPPVRTGPSKRRRPNSPPATRRRPSTLRSPSPSVSSTPSSPPPIPDRPLSIPCTCWPPRTSVHPTSSVTTTVPCDRRRLRRIVPEGK